MNATTIKTPTLINISLDQATTDGQVIEQIKCCNVELYREIVERYQKKLFIYIYHMVGNKEEVEDILQNVFVKVYNNIDTFDTTKKFSSWIYRIAHNEAVNHLKRKSRKRFISWEDVVTGKDKLDTSSPERNPEENWLREELKQEVDSALDKLPEKYREVLVLRYNLGKSYEDMSGILHKPANTVGTLLNRAKKKLFEVIQEMERAHQ